MATLCQENFLGLFQITLTHSPQRFRGPGRMALAAAETSWIYRI